MQLPESFVRSTRLLFGEERFECFLKALEEEPPVSIRMNEMKSGEWRVGSGERLTPVPWCSSGYYLPSRPNFTFDPLLHAGCYYVQEASSMFVDHVLRQHVHSPVLMLDLCAAPGGKSTAARSALPEGSVLVSNEPVRLRSQILAENIVKWGGDDCIVTNNYPRDFRKAKARFDVILCDVPCSGEGMFRKDAQAVTEWTPQNVERCWQLQREIVADAWQCLADGGLMIYSTCTYNVKEDEQNVRWMMEELGAVPLSVPTNPEWNITGSLLEGFDAPVYRFIPGFTQGEGLFMAVLRKPGNESLRELPSRSQLSSKALAQLTVLHPVQKVPDRKGREPSPQHAEALSVSLDKSKYPFAPLDYHTAVNYLRGEAVVLAPDVPRGYVIVTFLDRPLGFVKNLGTRANNLYPKEWRIKSTHIPQEYDETIFRLA